MPRMESTIYTRFDQIERMFDRTSSLGAAQ
jgi:hypothetical protein